MSRFVYTPKHLPELKRKHWPKIKNWPWRLILKWLIRLAALGVLALVVLFIVYGRDLPNPNRLVGRNVPESTKIYDRDGALLYEIHGEVKRTLVNLDQISPQLVQATLSAEDKDFYNHGGISVTGIMRSFLKNLVSLRVRQGGSTITQQFVKKALLTDDRTVTRKLKEVILSISLEFRFSKDEILKMYLNEIPYGRNSYGIEAASQTYFNKSAKNLTLAQAAYLAALPQAPSFYNPTGPNFDSLQARQQWILGQMKEQKKISEEEYQAAMNEPVVFTQIKTAIKAPHFVQYVQGYLAEKYGEQTLEEGGLKVYTTLNLKYQEIAEKAVKEGVEKNAKANSFNGGLVAIDPKTGQILAMVGSKDYFGENYPEGCITGKSCYFEPQVNTATALRQPGSSFKPFAYVTAFGKDYNYAPATMLMDVNTDFGGGYEPKNFNLAENGPVSMRKALAGSLNIPAVKTLALVGEEKVIANARKMGITSKMQNCGLSLVLGGCEVKLLDHVSAYATLASGGIHHQKTAVLKIVDKEGQTIEEFKDQSETVLDPQAVYLLTDIMTDDSARAYVFGAKSALTLPGRKVAAKTGTTQNFRDGWTLGFTPSLATGVWVGNNNSPNGKGLMTRDAISVAAPIWNRFMKEVLADQPAEDFPEPKGINRVAVDSVSGKLPTSYSPETKTEVFADYNIPTDSDNVHQNVIIDRTTGLPANSLTPQENRGEAVLSVFTSERPDNPAWEQPVRAWAAKNGYFTPETLLRPDSTIPNESLSVNFISPIEDDVLVASPINVKLNVTGQPSEVKIFLDGDLIDTLNSGPYQTQINKPLSDGSHTLAAQVKSGSSTSSTSIQFRTSFNSPLTMLNPNVMSDQIELAAKSPYFYPEVSFYLVSGTKTSLLGTGEAGQEPGQYRYQLILNTIPEPGNYKIYAKNSNGQASSKVNLNITK